MICYRQHDHTTADDASRYEPKNLRETEWKKEPITRLQRYLEKRGVWTAEQQEKLQTECAAEVDVAVKEYLQLPPQPLESMFDYLYASLPAIYQEQRDMLKTMGTNEHHG
jgi:pyruvate dehydrogenase E1 component alpha subunit